MPTLPPVHPNARRNPHTTVMVWHDIVPSTKLVWFDTTVREFEAQLAELEKVGASPISLDALYTYLAMGTNPPPPGACVLCFDDNTLGIYKYAFPLLKKRGWPFVVSAHTAYVGVRTGKDHCTYAQLRKMEQGGARVVSQTHTHPPDLRTLDDAALQDEMTESKRRMEDAMGRMARFVTYPSGKWDKRVALAAQDAGYQLGLTEDNGLAELSTHLLGLKRFSTHKRYHEAIRAVRKSAGR